MIPELHSQGISIVPAGPGAHVPVAERYIQTIKGRVRSFEHSLPYVMTRTILIFCVLFCASAMNLVIPTDRMLQVSPQEQFTGRRLNIATDLRFGFGDYVQATVANTDNTMKTRTEGCIALLSTGSSSGSVRMLHLATDRVYRLFLWLISSLPIFLHKHPAKATLEVHWTPAQELPTPLFL